MKTIHADRLRIVAKRALPPLPINGDQQKVSRNIQGIRTRKTNARRVLTTLQITAIQGEIPAGKPTITLSSRSDPYSELSIQKTLRVNRTVSSETPDEETTPAVLMENSQNHPDANTTNKIYWIRRVRKVEQQVVYIPTPNSTRRRPHSSRQEPQFTPNKSYGIVQVYPTEAKTVPMETVVREKRHRSRSSLRKRHESESELKTVSSNSPRQATTPIKDQVTRGRRRRRSGQKHKRVTGKPHPAAIH